MQAEPHDVGLFGVLGRILWVAGGAIALAVLLAPGSGTAHAADEPDVTVDATSTQPDPDVDDPTSVTALWADPASVSAAAARRAGADTASSIEATPWRPPVPEPERRAGRPDVGVPVPGVLASTPLGSFGGGGGAPDAGPSVAQLAVLSAALVGVRRLSQGLRASELSWRSALVISGIERPG